MQNSEEQVLLGTRIPIHLKEKLSKYCLSHGVKMNYLITQAIKEKLQDIVEERLDITEANTRLQNSKFTSQKEFDKYLLKRGIKH